MVTVIAADHITFDDDTAWLVTEGNDNHPPTYWAKFNRPCDTCDGTGFDLADVSRHLVEMSNGQPAREVSRCSGCNGTGRHTFDIEVGYDGIIRPHAHRFRYRVSIVEGMVLPIYGEDAEQYNYGRWIETLDDDAFQFWWDEEQQRHRSDHVTLPSAAKPGMWAVLLRVSP